MTQKTKGFLVFEMRYSELLALLPPLLAAWSYLLAPEIRQSALVDFLNTEDADRILALSSPQLA